MSTTGQEEADQLLLSGAADGVGHGRHAGVLRLLRGECHALGGFALQVRQRRDVVDAVRARRCGGHGRGRRRAAQPALVARHHHGACRLQEVVRYVPGARPAQDVAAVVGALIRTNAALAAQVTMAVGWPTRGVPDGSPACR